MSTLLIKNGRVMDPASKLDGVTDILIADGKIAAIEKDIEPLGNAEVFDATGRIVAAVAEPCSIAFATTSSEAALPRAMENMEALGVPRRVVAFVIPTGYSFNLDGSGIQMALSALFIGAGLAHHGQLGHHSLEQPTGLGHFKNLAPRPHMLTHDITLVG